MIVRAVPSESNAPLTVKLITGAIDADSAARNVPALNEPVTTPAAPAAADETPPDDVAIDPVPVEPVTLGTEIVGTLSEVFDVLGITTVGTLIDGAEI